jgi:hypothetical protein
VAESLHEPVSSESVMVQMTLEPSVITTVPVGEPIRSVLVVDRQARQLLVPVGDGGLGQAEDGRGRLRPDDHELLRLGRAEVEGVGRIGGDDADRSPPMVGASSIRSADWPGPS